MVRSTSMLICPVQFVVENQKMFAHRIILCAANAKFRAMLAGGMSETTQREVEVSGISFLTFKVSTKILNIHPKTRTANWPFLFLDEC